MTPALVRPPLYGVRSRLFDSSRWTAYRPRPDDIVVATYPKCGTTWTQRIVGMLLAGDAAPAPLGGPWFDFRLRQTAREIAGEAEAITGRRHLKTHLPFDALPVYEGVKFIHVARDGRDAALSFHNHTLHRTPANAELIDQVSLADPKFGDRAPRAPSDPAEYFRAWLLDGGALGDAAASYWAMERSYWAARGEANMLLVHYADMKADLAREIARIARFLDIELPPPTMAEITDAADFDAMREQGEQILPGAEAIWDGGADRFLHKGVNGRWKDVLTARDLAAYEAKVEDEFSPALAAWLEYGRLIAGDPERTAT